MKKKRMITLIFSLFTVAVSSNLKASETGFGFPNFGQPRQEKLKEREEKFKKAVFLLGGQMEKLKEEQKKYNANKAYLEKEKNNYNELVAKTRGEFQSERNNLATERNNLATERINLATERINLDTKKKDESRAMQVNLVGTAIAEAVDFGLSYFDNENFKFIGKAMRDSKSLHRFYSLFPNKQASIDDYYNFRENSFLAGVANVLGETASSLALRLSWNKWCDGYVKKGNNFVTKFIHESPDLLKNIARLAAVNKCWNLLKSKLLFRQK